MPPGERRALALREKTLNPHSENLILYSDNLILYSEG
jgi:hypothetical protein